MCTKRGAVIILLNHTKNVSIKIGKKYLKLSFIANKKPSKFYIKNEFFINIKNCSLYCDLDSVRTLSWLCYNDVGSAHIVASPRRPREATMWTPPTRRPDKARTIRAKLVRHPDKARTSCWFRHHDVGFAHTSSGL
jgi:hypothetical protein